MVLQVLVMYFLPRNRLLVFIIHLITQRFTPCHPANNSLLLFASQIVQCNAVGTETPNKSNDIQVSFHFGCAKFDQSMELGELLILDPVVAVAQNIAKVLKVDKLWKLEANLIKLILFE